jgi:hypothetical protein
MTRIQADEEGFSEKKGEIPLKILEILLHPHQSFASSAFKNLFITADLTVTF